MNFVNYAPLFAAIFFAGLVDSIAGGGGLISLPAYLAAGIPYHVAAGTNKFSSMLGTCISVFRFVKNKAFNFSSIIFSVPMALIGSYLGARLALSAEERVLHIFLLVSLPVVAFIVITNKNMGECCRPLPSKHRIAALSIISAFLIGCYDGFFGPGTGTFLIIIHNAVIGFSLINASGNAKIINLSTNIAALFAFIVSGSIDYRLAVGAAICNIAGNWIGSGLAFKKGAKVIRPMFIIVLILLFASIIIKLF